MTNTLAFANGFLDGVTILMGIVGGLGIIYCVVQLLKLRKDSK